MDQITISYKVICLDRVCATANEGFFASWLQSLLKNKNLRQNIEAQIDVKMAAHKFARCLCGVWI